MEGLVFNIQKFSLNDGPGIRTVVFLKGCPLRCAWCSNPESQFRTKQILWDPSLCVRCKTCVNTCPKEAIILTEKGIRIKRRKCTGCEACISACPREALKPDSHIMTVSQVLKKCKQDMPFYEESGGGVTLSGGEALCQSDFSALFLNEAKKENISTALESSCYAPYEIFDKVIENVDYLLADMKHWCNSRHKEKTGVSNDIILSNIRRAVKKGKNVLLRIPVIPGFNDSPEDADGFADVIKGLGLSRAQLLPFHQFGEKKYTMLGMKYEYANADALHEEDLIAFRQRFMENGVKAFF